jgi:protein phosphatase
VSSKSDHFSYESAFFSDVGRVRAKNEDNGLVISDKSIFAVADGMGGHSSGEVASKISIEAIEACFSSADCDALARTAFNAWRSKRSKTERNRNFPEFRLWQSLKTANLQIYNRAQRYAQYRDMGTTIVATYFVGKRVYVGYVGDSRVYRMRDGKLVQLTEDHSLANEYVRMKILRKEDVSRFPYKNVIVRALGLSADVEVDTQYSQCRSGDLYLLCSDGLTDLVTDQEIQDLITTSNNVQDCGLDLVRAANERGGLDNITVLIVKVTD